MEGLHAVPFDLSSPEQDFKRRGLADAPLDFPYRDDARLIWSALERWVGAYVALYYPRDAAVQKDSELQAWAAELVSRSGGRLQGFGEPDGKIRTRDYLIHALTLVIFTASAQHAAVNFPQYAVMSNAASFPLGLYADPPKKGATEEDFLAMLPPLEQALIQLNLGFLLGSIHYSQLGDYDEDAFDDPRVQPLLRALRADLRQAGDSIELRNRKRRRPYPYLHPEQVPQSINI